jgi:hypothetical protein
MGAVDGQGEARCLTVFPDEGPAGTLIPVLVM